MNILLVRTPRIKQAVTLSDFMYSEPLGLEMIYGLLKEDHTVEIFDMMCDTTTLEAKLADFEPHVVAITSLCVDVLSVIKIAEAIKSYDMDIITVVGGTQALLNPQCFMESSIDHIFKFTNTVNIKRFYGGLGSSSDLADLEGVLSKEKGYRGAEIKGVNEYILPDRTSTMKYREHYSYFGYKPAAIMQIATGCEKACMFCLRWRIEGYKEVALDLNLLKMDLASIEEDTIMLYDNDILSSEKRLNDFLDLVNDMGLKKNFIAYASVEGILKYKKVLKRFRDNGLKALLVGYETFSDDELDYYTKNTSVTDSESAAKLMKDLGIDVWASFMANPDWNKNDFKTFRKYVKSLKPQISSVSPLTPFPNLPLYDQYKDRLLFATDDYEKWSFGQVMIKPMNMTTRQYYYQMMLTNLYINLSLNSSTEMMSRFGIKNFCRLSLGSSKAFFKYVNLMLKA